MGIQKGDNVTYFCTSTLPNVNDSIKTSSSSAFAEKASSMARTSSTPCVLLAELLFCLCTTWNLLSPITCLGFVNYPASGAKCDFPRTQTHMHKHTDKHGYKLGRGGGEQAAVTYRVRIDDDLVGRHRLCLFSTFQCVEMLGFRARR